MEFTTGGYKRCVGNVFTTADGFRYVQSKITENYTYLKCAIFRNGCKGTSKLNRTRNLIAPMHPHNHEVSEYKADVNQLKTNCKTVVKQVQSSSLRQVFDDVTRNNPCARDVSFAECESAMYRARRTCQPKIPLTAAEFLDMLGTTALGVHFKLSVSSENQTAVIFFSDEIRALLIEATNIQFDGTFYTVPNQFYQLWTIFVAVGRHTIPAVHCLMTAKTEGIYKAVLDSLVAHIPGFKPVASMSDWEQASRNAFNEVFPQIRIYGCVFHYTQCIWSKVRKLGLSHGFKSNTEISKFARLLMAIPFLPASLITPTFDLIPTPSLEANEASMVEKLKKYVKRYWLNHITPEDLSIFYVNISTNNGAESYHSKLKVRIRSSHPRIW